MSLPEWSESLTISQYAMHLSRGVWLEMRNNWLGHPVNRQILILSNCVHVAQWLEHCVSSAKVVGSIPREQTYWQYKCIAWMHCKSLWIKASAKCINVNVNWSPTKDTQKHGFKSNQNQITFIVTSPQHKCLGEWNSYERAPDSAKKTTDNLPMDRQCKKTTNNLPMDRQCKKLHWSIYSAPDSAKKNNSNLHMDRQCKKKQQQFTYGQTVQKKTTAIYIWTDSAKKTTAIYIWTDSAKKTTAIYIWTDSAKNNSNLHMDSTYLQTVQKTMCKIHIHILSTLSVL